MNKEWKPHRSFIDPPQFVTTEKILRQDVDVMGSENKLITAVGMAAVQKVFQKPFQQLGMQTSIQFVDDENCFPSLLQLCKGREEIQKPLRTFGFFIQLKSNVFAVQVFMNGEELFENQFIIFHSNDDVIASKDVARAAQLLLDFAQ